MPTTTEERPRVYLNKVHLKGYKSIEDVTIDFQKGLNILIGKNGAGKSNFLELINKVVNYRVDSKEVFKYVKLEFVSNDNHSFLFEFEQEPQRARVIKEILAGGNELSERFIVDGKIEFDNFEDKGVNRQFFFKNRRINYGPIPILFSRLRYPFNSFIIKYGLPEHLVYIASPGVIRAEIDDGYISFDSFEGFVFLNHAFWSLDFYFSQLSDVERNEISPNDVIQNLTLPEETIDNLKRYSPIEDVSFRNINIYKEGEYFIIDNVKIDFKINGIWLPWSQLSDGTRRLFYIVTEVSHSTGLVLLEEPELGVHPHQFHLLMNFLKEQSENKQIIISTHAPKALDHLSFDELDNILITYYDPEKGTQLKHLSDKEKAKAVAYANEVGFLSDYWLHSDLEE